MSRIAYVNGRYLPRSAAKVSIEDRGYQFADGVYEVCEVRAGRLVDERRHMARLERSLSELRIARPMSPAALAIVLRETVRRNRVHDGIVYLQITRGVARRDFPFPPIGHQALAGGDCARQRPCPARANGGRRHRRGHHARHPLGPRRYQVGGAAAQRAGQAGRARAGRARGLAGRRARPRHRRRLVECLDRQPRRQTRHASARPRYPAPASRARSCST